MSLFTGQFDAIRVELQTMAVPMQFNALRDGRLDVGFVRPPVRIALGATLVAVPAPLALVSIGASTIPAMRAARRASVSFH